MKTSRRKSKKVNKAWLHDHLTDPYVKLAQQRGLPRARRLQAEGDRRAAAPARARPVRRRPRRGARAPGASTCGASSRRRRGAAAPPRAAERHDHRARHAADGADRGRRLHRRATSASRRCWPARGSASAGRQVDVVLSDMAPNLSGIAAVRCRADGRPGRAGGRFRRGATCKPEGALVCKVFHGSGYSQLVELFKATFPDRQAGQAEGVAGQVGRDLPGRNRPQAARASGVDNGRRSARSNAPAVGSPRAAGLA